MFRKNRNLLLRMIEDFLVVINIFFGINFNCLIFYRSVLPFRTQREITSGLLLMCYFLYVTSPIVEVTMFAVFLFLLITFCRVFLPSSFVISNVERKHIKTITDALFSLCDFSCRRSDKLVFEFVFFKPVYFAEVISL